MSEITPKTIGDALRESLAKDESYHIPAAEGDYIDDDNYLCCGVCGKHKEFRRFMPAPFSFWLIQPSMCECAEKQYELDRLAEQQRKDQALVDELRSYSLIDEAFRESTFDNFQVTSDNATALKICKNYVKHFDTLYESNKGLLLYGTPGTGKTFAAACIANALMQKGVPVLVTSIVRLTNNSVFADEPMDILSKIRRAKLLVLDDFGVERDSDFKYEQVFDLIDSRIASKRPMIITTNIPLENFKKDTDIKHKRVYDRLLNACHPVKMDWESFRQKSVRSTYYDTKALLEE